MEVSGPFSADAMDAYRVGNELVVYFDLPGVDPSSIELTVEQRPQREGRAQLDARRGHRSGHQRAASGKVQPRRDQHTCLVGRLDVIGVEVLVAGLASGDGAHRLQVVGPPRAGRVKATTLSLRRRDGPARSERHPCPQNPGLKPCALSRSSSSPTARWAIPCTE